ncbi:MAG TPA: aspartate--tRNA ligase [Nanoarchaeota archaeon]|nr:MAG: aspartyl-tRNA synthetase [archaeon GW2011_AR18]HIH26240.1 aspartate--tRNA ligase [Nanoarchaeota archaeon]
MFETSYRTHTCGQLISKDIKKDVKICGWVASQRNHGGIIFIDLRDKYGFTQVVLDPIKIPEADKLRREWCIQIEGKVRLRPTGMENKTLITGEIEVDAAKLEIISESEVPPFEIDDKTEANEELRLKYRYLDLRRPIMQQNLLLRHKVAQAAREYLSSQAFTEIETPILVKPTPEGARDYLVPSRINPGKFYALPQSPQLYKQILMVGGCDRYFQLARCLRDEDLRADRQPEHTQIDIEMSFANEEDIFKVVEGLMEAVFKTRDIKIKKPFVRITYNEAMSKYGSDKPDLRFGLELIDVSDIVKNSNFDVFKSIINDKGVVKCLNATECGKFSRTEIDELIELAKRHHAKGMAWARVEKGKLESSITKYIDDNIQKELIKTTKAKDGDLLLFIADKFKTVCTSLGQVRLNIANKLNIIPKNEYKFCWITDFPLFSWNDEDQKFEPEHHPFCMPKKEHIKLLDTDPGKVYATLYDLVLNGVELCSGSLRIHKPDIQKKIFSIIGLSEKEAEKKFGFLLEAYKYAGPPHGGVGIGVDRLVGLLIGLVDIREVIAFPKNKSAECPMDGSPGDIDEKQIKELHIKLDVVKK